MYCPRAAHGQATSSTASMPRRAHTGRRTLPCPRLMTHPSRQVPFHGDRQLYVRLPGRATGAVRSADGQKDGPARSLHLHLSSLGVDSGTTTGGKEEPMRSLSLAGLALAAVIVSLGRAAAQPPAGPPPGRFVPGRLLPEGIR